MKKWGKQWAITHKNDDRWKKNYYEWLPLINSFNDLTEIKASRIVQSNTEEEKKKKQQWRRTESQWTAEGKCNLFTKYAQQQNCLFEKLCAFLDPFGCVLCHLVAYI